jgi:N-acetylglutamate synthase-like GNAT family acetyltransferase
MTSVKVRDATPVDFPAILDMLRRGRETAPFKFLLEANYADHVIRQLTEFISGRGMAIVSESNQLTGFMLAALEPNFWNPKTLLMVEVAYWVKPEFRGGMSAHRLITEYCARGNAMKAERRIDHFVIGKTTKSPDLSFSKFGFSKLEEFWVN